MNCQSGQCWSCSTDPQPDTNANDWMNCSLSTPATGTVAYANCDTTGTYPVCTVTAAGTACLTGDTCAVAWESCTGTGTLTCDPTVCATNADCSTNNCVGTACYPCSATPQNTNWSCTTSTPADATYTASACSAANVCTYTYAECTENSGCTDTNLCVGGKCYTCAATPTNYTTDCASGTFATGETSADWSGACTADVCVYSATCALNSDCTTQPASGLCVSGVCTACAADADCGTGALATDDKKTSGTCDTATGACTFVQMCENNGDCDSNLCISAACADACTDAANCMTGTFADDTSYEATCTSGVCAFEETGLSGGAIAGIIIGSVVFVLAVVLAIYFLTKGGESEASKAVAYEQLEEHHEEEAHH